MKEIYIAPELEILQLVSYERLATDGDVDFDDFFETGKEAVSNPDTDFDIDLDDIL